MKKTFIIAIFISMAVGCQEKNERLKREGEPDIIFVEPEDDEMNVAIENARKSFKKEFHPALMSNNPNFSNFAIKQRYELPNGSGEHIWIGDILFKNNKYYGIVHNEPFESIGVKFGDSVIVNLDNLSDWMYNDKNVVKGAFTKKVLRKTMTEEEKR